ncbi:sigma 54-interacting transcriptional regulator [Evansella sp. AB-P1]|uniref:sigma-54 interaction domain-containing protein n=1 Tax=Evansella sp. AB-P1 TaxID=3037653 RepID=UPI00241FCAE5|nr:sigma 54-interacting transcriptional regulator [Evansella sp. AB-P1]MDG5787958.1 sigma 54-interacting transcriptional regulator [Evansella sp. AB-P1]
MKNISLPQIHPLYNQILDAVDVGIHVVNEEGISVIYNKKMSEIEDMDKTEVINKKIMEVFLFQREEESRLLLSLRNGDVLKNAKQTYFNLKGQKITTINDTFPLTHDNKIVGAVEVARDITKLERLTKENIRNKNEANYTFEQIIGNSALLNDVKQSAQKATRTSSSVLIYGETGTGKELFAQSIHNASNRSAKPLISQNCAALPETLIESILFGTVKGAFTGAIEHAGLFEQACGGSIMLDEINSLSAPLQAKLLRVIQEKMIRRIGDSKDRKIDVRIIATLNEEPIVAIKQNKLREDLYYRLSVVSIEVPPLRKRKEDIPLLVEHFINKYNKQFQLNVPFVCENVMDMFKNYDWPGNVRELEHMIEGAMNLIHYDEKIEYSHLPLHVRNKFSRYDIQQLTPTTLYPNDPPKSLQSFMEEGEKLYIKRTLDYFNGNITQAANSLGISRQSLQYRLKKYQLKEIHKKS